MIDPYDRLAESNESNNQASKSFTILTRPDLAVQDIGLSEPEPIEGTPLTVSLDLANSGQTPSGTSILALYDGDPSNGGSLVAESSLPLAAGSNQSVDFSWTPSGLGAHRLFVKSDRDDTVDESDEGNNLTWLDVYVGLPAPVWLDSGAV